MTAGFDEGMKSTDVWRMNVENDRGPKTSDVDVCDAENNDLLSVRKV